MKFWLILIAAGLWLAVAACATSQPSGLIAPETSSVRPIASVPYRVDYDGWLAIDVMMNGRGPYSFIIDTGATVTAVFEKAAQPEIFKPTGGDDKRVLGVTGSRYAPPVEIGDITVGAAGLINHVGVVIPDWEGDGDKPDGLIGLDFLAGYLTVFDARTRMVHFYPAQNPPTDVLSNLTKIPMRFSEFNQETSGLFTLNVNIRGRRIPVIFDLGANGTMMNYNAFRRLVGGIYIDQAGPGSQTGTRIKGVFGDETRARALETGPVRIGPISFGHRTLLIFNASIFTELGIHRKPYGLLGADLLRDRSFAIDLREAALYISRDPIVARQP